MKKVLSILLATATAFSVCGGLAACGGGGDGKTITVWGPSAARSVYEQLFDDFKEANPDYNGWTFKYEAHEEDKVQSDLGQAPETKAHVFFFPPDHLMNMMKKGCLQVLPASIASEVKARDSEDTVDFVTRGKGTADEKIYAFPATDDNGYFLYYDKTVFTNPNDVKSLTTIQNRARTDKKKVLFAYGSGYYAASFFMGVGCHFDFTDDTMTEYVTDVDNDLGKAAAQACYSYFNPTNNGNGSEATIIIDGDVNTGIGTSMANGSMIAAIGGSWAYADIKAKMIAAGRDVKDIVMTELPYFDVTINGQATTRQMGSMVGAKYCGVNSLKSEEEVIVSLALAKYLTGPEGQLARYRALNAGPTNKNVAALDEVQNDPILKAYRDQKAHMGYIQRDQKGAFWDCTFVKDIANGTTKAADVLDALDSWAAELRGTAVQQ